MARSVEKEITALLQHELEQSPAFHRYTRGEKFASVQEGFDLLGQLGANQGLAIRKLAAEIDELRRILEVDT